MPARKKSRSAVPKVAEPLLPLLVTLVNHRRNKFHISHPLAMCEEAVELTYRAKDDVRRVEVLFDPADPTSTEAFVCQHVHAVIYPEDVCSLCTRNLLSGLRRQSARKQKPQPSRKQ